MFDPASAEPITSPLASVKLGRIIGSSLAVFFFLAAIFVAWRCFAVGIARPLPMIVMFSTALLLTSMGWSARLVATALQADLPIARTPSATRHASAIPTTEDVELSELAADIVQQLTLRTTPEGVQELSGWLRMNLVTGQRTGTLHVAFCPPFEKPPAVEAEAVSGPDCRIKVAEAQSYGARLEIKLNGSAAADESVLVSFFAVSELA
jgi:hypothetical protein